MADPHVARRIRLGQVGGGEGAFIGAVHRIAARLDDRYELVAGCFASTPERSRASARALGIAGERAYGDFGEMAEREAARADGIEAVSIVTPNHLHYPAAEAFLRRGIHVICDKPLTSTLGDARRLHEVALAAREESGARLVVTYNYSGYPLIRQARAMVAAGELGEIRVAQVEYAQDWLARDAASDGPRRSSWRADPRRAGGGGAIGDIGTHAFHLLGFVTGSRPDRLSAELSTFTPGGRLDDDAAIALRYASGMRARIWCSQVASGHENGLRLRVHGSKGGLDWSQENPNVLRHAPLGEPVRLLTRGGPALAPESLAVTRIPAGHPEGFLEGFATLYREAADLFAGAEAPHLPDIDDGLRGVAFVDACLRSGEADGAWVSL